MLAVIIPAYNEEATVARTVAAAGRVPAVTEIIVVDDGSRDGTCEAAKKAGAAVLRLPFNCGKGHALNCGFLATKAPYLAFLDADVGETAVELAKLWEPVEAGIFDMAVGKLVTQRGRGGLGLVRGLARWGCARLAGCRLEAPISGQRVLDARLMRQLYPLVPDFGVEIDLTIRALLAGFRLGEVPVAMAHRVTGRELAGFWHRGRQFWHIGRALVRQGLAEGWVR